MPRTGWARTRTHRRPSALGAVGAVALAVVASLVPNSSAAAAARHRCVGHGRHRRCRPQRVPPLKLTSPAFANGAAIPSSYTCKGGSTSPPLAWTNIPRGTRELELLVTDPDAPSGPVSHWVLYGIPVTDRSAPQGGPPPGAHQGTNTVGTQSYIPPCPLPVGSTHHYTFQLFASNALLHFARPPTDKDVRSALKGHTLATAQLVGTYALPG